MEPDQESMLFRACKGDVAQWNLALAGIARDREEKRRQLALAISRDNVHLTDGVDDDHKPPPSPWPAAQAVNLAPVLDKLGECIDLVRWLIHKQAQAHADLVKSPEFLDLFTDFLLDNQEKLRPYFQDFAAKPKQRRPRTVVEAPTEEAQEVSQP